MSLTNKEIEILQQLVITEENNISSRVNELEESLKKDDPLLLKEYIIQVIGDKKEYHNNLTKIEYKLRGLLK